MKEIKEMSEGSDELEREGRKRGEEEKRKMSNVVEKVTEILMRES